MTNMFGKNIFLQNGKNSLINLNGRVKWLKYTLGCASFGFLFNMLTVFALYLEYDFFGKDYFWILLFSNDSFSHIFY